MRGVQIVKYVQPSNARTPVEVYQPTGITFTFLSSPKTGNKQCSNFLFCRDFLADMVYTTVTGNCTHIYRFTYEIPNNPPVDLKRVRMLVRYPCNDVNVIRQKTESALSLLRHYENKAGWLYSRTLKVSGHDDVRLFLGDPKWMLNSFLLSMYTFLIRLGDKEIIYRPGDDLIKTYKDLLSKHGYIPGPGIIPHQDNDIKYLGKCFDKMHLAIEHRKKLFSEKMSDNYSSKSDIHAVHDMGGIFSLCTFGAYSAYNMNINLAFRNIYETYKNKSK